MPSMSPSITYLLSSLALAPPAEMICPAVESAPTMSAEEFATPVKSPDSAADKPEPAAGAAAVNSEPISVAPAAVATFPLASSPVLATPATSPA